MLSKVNEVVDSVIFSSGDLYKSIKDMPTNIQIYIVTCLYRVADERYNWEQITDAIYDWAMRSGVRIGSVDHGRWEYNETDDEHISAEEYFFMDANEKLKHMNEAIMCVERDWWHPQNVVRTGDLNLVKYIPEDVVKTNIYELLRVAIACHWNHIAQYLMNNYKRQPDDVDFVTYANFKFISLFRINENGIDYLSRFHMWGAIKPLINPDRCPEYKHIIYMAAMNNNNRLIKTLKADWKDGQYDFSPLHWAVIHGNLQMAIDIVDKFPRINVNYHRPWTCSPLSLAEYLGREEIARYLRSVGGRYINSPVSPNHCVDHNGNYRLEAVNGFLTVLED